MPGYKEKPPIRDQTRPYLWAIGLKGWVELRLAATKPKKEASEAFGEAFEVQVFDSWGRATNKRQLVKQKFRSVDWVGGDLAAVIPLEEFRYLTLKSPVAGQLIGPSDENPRLLKIINAWRKQVGKLPITAWATRS